MGGKRRHVAKVNLGYSFLTCRYQEKKAYVVDGMPTLPRVGNGLS